MYICKHAHQNKENMFVNKKKKEKEINAYVLYDGQLCMPVIAERYI